MTNCNNLQEKLTEQERLSNTELAHVEECPDCSEFTKTIKEIENLAAAHNMVDETTESQAQVIRDRFTESIRPEPFIGRFGWVAVAMLAGCLITAAVTFMAKDIPDIETTGNKLLALVDEVDEITNPEYYGEEITYNLVFSEEEYEEGSLLPHDYLFLPAEENGCNL